MAHNILKDPRQCPNIFCQISLGKQSVPYKMSLIKKTECIPMNILTIHGWNFPPVHILLVSLLIWRNSFSIKIRQLLHSGCKGERFTHPKIRRRILLFLLCMSDIPPRLGNECFNASLAFLSKQLEAWERLALSQQKWGVLKFHIRVALGKDKTNKNISVRNEL